MPQGKQRMIDWDMGRKVNLWFALSLSTVWGIIIAFAVSHVILTRHTPAVTDTRTVVTRVAGRPTESPVVRDAPAAPLARQHAVNATTPSGEAPTATEAPLTVSHVVTENVWPAEEAYSKEVPYSPTPRARDTDRAISDIARQAARRIALLEQAVALNDEQRAEAFQSFAFAAASAAGVVDSSDVTLGDVQQTAEEEIHEVLDAEQQEEYEDDWVDRDRWWTEIIGILEADLEESDVADTVTDDAPAVDDEPTPTTEVQEDTHAGGNLFDLLGQ